MIENRMVVGLERDEPVQVAECAWCGGEIYAGDEVLRIDDGGGFVHDDGGDCAAEYAKERVYDAAGVIDRMHNVN